jgi:hypothetical protein
MIATERIEVTHGTRRTVRQKTLNFNFGFANLTAINSAKIVWGRKDIKKIENVLRTAM